jgi:hypothetical protein
MNRRASGGGYPTKNALPGRSTAGTSARARARGGEERADVVDLEDALLDERVDRLRQILCDDGRDRVGGLTDEAFAIVGIRRGQRVRREVGDRDIDRRIRLRPSEEPKLPELLRGVQTVAALCLDRRRAKLGGIADAPHQQL